MCEDMINYIGRRERSTGISGPQDSAQSVTEIMDILNYFLSRSLLKRLPRTQTIAQQCKNSKGNLFSERIRMNEWKTFMADEII
jgi:hypothetical protein